MDLEKGRFFFIKTVLGDQLHIRRKLLAYLIKKNIDTIQKKKSISAYKRPEQIILAESLNYLVPSNLMQQKKEKQSFKFDS